MAGGKKKAAKASGSAESSEPIADGAIGETKDVEKRAVPANKAGKPSGQPSALPPKASLPYTISVKASLDNDTRILNASLMITYAELKAAVKTKFPNTGPFVLKYLDKNGHDVTIASRSDIENYLTEIVVAYQTMMAGSGNAPKQGSQLPPMRIQVIKVDSEADVPKPPPEEIQAAKLKGKEESQPQQQDFELDEWLVEFAHMFTEVTGIDPVNNPAHLNLGHDKISRAVDASLSHDKAIPLYDKAAEHFREATCGSTIQWGNAFIIKADRQAQNLLRAGKAVDGKAVDAMLKEYDESEKKFNEALKVKPDSWEAHGSMGQLEWERAKAKMSYVVPAPVSDDTSKEADEASKAEANAAVKEALAKLDAKKVGSVQKHIDNVNKWFDKALVFAKAAEEKKKVEAEAAAGKETKKEELTPEQKQKQQMESPSGNMLVMHGNILYEWSQVLAAISKEWKPTLDSAESKFRSAGAAETEIRSALKNHCMKDQLNLGPDPEPEKPPEAQEKAKAPEAKGLPSLEVKKKSK